MPKLPSDTPTTVALIKEVTAVRSIFVSFARSNIPHFSNQEYKAMAEIAEMLKRHIPTPVIWTPTSGSCPNCSRVILKEVIDAPVRMYCKFCGQHVYTSDAKQQKPKTKQKKL